MVKANIGGGVQGAITGAGTGFSVGGPVGAGVGGVLGGLGGLFGAGAEKREKLRTFDPYTSEQRAYSNQLLQGAQGQQGNILNYLNSILSNDPELMNQFESPDIQNFQRRVVPGIAERFAGLGAGSSSALNQTLGEAGKELQLGLSQQRANLKQQALQQLLNMGQQGLQGQLTPYIKGGRPSIYSQLAPFAAQGLQQMGEQQGGGFGNVLDWLKSKLSGGMPATSAQVTGSSNFGLPGFLQM